MLYGVIDIEKGQFPAIGDSLTRLNIFKGTGIQTKTNSPWTALKNEMLNSLFFYHWYLILFSVSVTVHFRIPDCGFNAFGLLLCWPEHITALGGVGLGIAIAHPLETVVLLHLAYMSWLNFILGLNLISLCFKLITIHYHTPKHIRK